MKKRCKETDHSGVVLNEEPNEESYKRYKYLCYRNLILKSLLTFVLGLLVAYMLKLC